MTGSNMSLKADLWMPLDIGEWRRDTAHLNPTEKSAYLALRMYYWEHGWLPKDPARLANIAQSSMDTWSITQEALSMHFFEGPDGNLHLAREHEKRIAWTLKRQKAREKALKAINTRWSKYRAKQRTQSISSSDTPSIPEEVLKENSKNLSVLQEQKQKQELPPTPVAAHRGMQPTGDTPSTPSTPPQVQVAESKSVGKAKPPKRAVVAIANGRDDAKPYQSPKHGVATLRDSKDRASRNGSHPSKADIRLQGFEKEVLEFWKGQNPEHPEYLFSGPDRRALGDLLDRHPGLSLGELRRLLQNRAASDINPAAAPHKWLRSIIDYSAGPLGKYGKPLREARTV